MKRFIIFAVTMLASWPLMADEINTGAGASAGAGAYSGSALNYNPTHNYASNDAADFSERPPTIFVPGLAGGTNPCIVSWSAGASIGSTSGLPGFGLSGGKAYTDEECNVRETLRLAAALTPTAFANEGDKAASQTFLRSIACQSKVMAAAMETTAQEHGPKYGCANTLPEGTEVSIRPIFDRGSDVVMIEKKNQDGTFQTRYAAEVDDIFPEGSGFAH